MLIPYQERARSFRIEADRKTPGRIFFAGPAMTSLDPDAARRLANALDTMADKLDGIPME